MSPKPEAVPSGAESTVVDVDPHGATIPSDPASRGAPQAPELVGRTLGHFRVDGPLGKGGMGAVYRAWDTSLEREVALKVVLAVSSTCSAADAAMAAARERFLREARVQAKLRHPNVVPIHFVGEAEGVTFLVMDLVDGESLADVLAQRATLDESRALDVADAIAAALEAGKEAGLVHRDVKPSNILLERGGRVLLADFGLAKTVAERRADLDAGPPSAREPGEASTRGAVLTLAGAIIGTPAYLAPEQGRGEAVDFRADMYSLGVTLYESLTGQPPFTAPTAAALVHQHIHQAPLAPRTLAPHLRPPVEALVLRLLSKDPAARFSSYGELRAALAGARAKTSVPAPFFPRAVAFLIDVALQAILAGLLAVVVRVGAIAWVGAVVAFAVLEHVWTTPGKRLLRLRVVDAKGEPASWQALVARSLLRMSGPVLWALDADLFGEHGLVHSGRLELGVIVAVAVTWLVGLGLALGKSGQALHDRAARTREVYALGP
ncbi:MAG TPA: protein kinase [Polyangiaceae bacterium]|nr:protein kinase [Polyangiaceae bacterium]